MTTANQLLRRLFWPAFVELDGCVFLAWACPTSATPQPPQLPDRTAVEAFHNQVHVLDHFQHSVAFTEGPGWDATHPHFATACDIGRAMANIWLARLAQSFPHRPFRVYFTAQDDPVVRFHTVHPDEAPWLNVADFAEAVADRQVLVLETPWPPSVHDA